MRAILEIDGWRKEMEVKEQEIENGVIEFELLPPFDCLIEDNRPINCKLERRVAFYLRGYLPDGKAHFLA